MKAGSLFAGIVGLAVVGVTASFALSTGAQADPPGNNATIKIDGIEFDSHPDNQPHVGCQFQVDFYGYDAGGTNASVSFAVHPPSGKPTVVLADEFVLEDDPAGGGRDVDAERTYDLSPHLGGAIDHAKQGFHVKVTVRAEGAKGADVKHKVFWVRSCITHTPTPTPTPTDLTT